MAKENPSKAAPAAANWSVDSKHGMITIYWLNWVVTAKTAAEYNSEDGDSVCHQDQFLLLMEMVGDGCEQKIEAAENKCDTITLGNIFYYLLTHNFNKVK